jgi:hypothetical protein
MDFTTVNPGPVIVKIDGTRYEIPRLLLPDMAAWMQELIDKRIERSTKHLDDDAKAKFLMYYMPPMFDVTDVATDVRTPDGIVRLLERQLPKAKPPVPQKLIKSLCQYGDPDQLRNLAEHIASAKMAAANIRAQTGGDGEDADPLQGRSSKPERGRKGSRSTGSKSKKKSLAPTEDLTKGNSPSTST